MWNQQQQIRRQRQHGRMCIERKKKRYQRGRKISLPPRPQSRTDRIRQQARPKRVDRPGQAQQPANLHAPQQIDRGHQRRLVKPHVAINHRPVFHLERYRKRQVFLRPQHPRMREVRSQQDPEYRREEKDSAQNSLVYWTER